jgi:hypothetical protein
MKKIIIGGMLLITTAATFGQQSNPSATLTKQDYLKKSRKQKTAAWLLMSSGFTCVVIGGVLSSDVNNISLFDEKTSKAGSVLSVVGLCSMAGSIPLFIAASKNKRKTKSLSFTNEKALQVQSYSLVYRFIPSVSLKIEL